MAESPADRISIEPRFIDNSGNRFSIFPMSFGVTGIRSTFTIFMVAVHNILANPTYKWAK